MYNFPIDASINGDYIFHEGNHDGRGNPHGQFIHKWDTCRTQVYNTSLTTPYAQIAVINYERDNNTTLGYKIELINEYATDKIGYLNISVGNTGVTNFSLNNNSYCDAYYTLTDTGSIGGKTQTQVCIYLKLSKNYRALYYRLYLAKNSQPIAASSYDDDYAYNCIELLTNQNLFGTITNATQASNIPTIGTTNISSIGDGTLSGAVGTINTATATYGGLTFSFYKVGRMCTLVITGSPTSTVAISVWTTILPQNNIPSGFVPYFTFGDTMLTVVNGVRTDIGYSNGNGISIFPRGATIATSDVINKMFTYMA